MNVFDIIKLFGGLAMFLYGMRLMGDGLKESSSGKLKIMMESVTNNPLKAFLLGVAVTAVIQSSTATIVITSGLVGAGILTLRQSLGIIVGANVGTTVTGQIIRLLDVDSSKAAWLEVFKPSTLAPVAMIIGIVLIMAFSKRTGGNIAVGFGILFSGLLNMTGAVDTLSETGVFDPLFASLSGNPFLGYITGAGVAFVLQSSSATIGILQAFSMADSLAWKAIYSVIVGIYLGDCVTTAIVCSIGAKPEAKRVGIVNILFNLSETVLVLAAVAVVHKLGLIDELWETTTSPGLIANTNTIFNLACAILLLPMVRVYEKLSRKIIKDEPEKPNKYQEKLDALSPVFFNTPALTLRSCYDILLIMLTSARKNIDMSFGLLKHFDTSVADAIEEEEENIDLLTDKVSEYMVNASPHIRLDYQVRILDQYYKVVTEFERLGDHAINIVETARNMRQNNVTFSKDALEELEVIKSLLDKMMDYATLTFEKRDIEAAYHIEPLEQVVDDMVNALKDAHIERLRIGTCNVIAGTNFLNLMQDFERISDHCSNIGIATITRVKPELSAQAHEYASTLHGGSDEEFNREYNAAHDEYFGMLKA